MPPANDKSYDPGARALRLVHKFFPQVTRVTDASRVLYLEVLPQDSVPEGRKAHAECAFAQACRRQFRVDGAIISISRAYLIRKEHAVRYDLPAAIGREITAFDRGAAPAQGVYRLLPPVKGHQLGRAKSKKFGPKLKKRRPPRHVTAGLRAVLSAAK